MFRRSVESVAAAARSPARLAAEGRALARRFGTGRSIGGPVRIVALGDSHRGGLRVSRIHWASGLTAIHKPRPVAPEILWSRTVGWLGTRTSLGPFLAPRIVARRTHGWIEPIGAKRPRSDREATRFFERAGALLALWDVLEVRDVHRGNLLAAGDQPVLIDAETIAHPRLGPFRGSPSLALTGFFPGPGSSDDRAGIFAGLPAAGRRSPGRPGPIRYLDPLLAGYRAGHRALRLHGAELFRSGGPLAGLGRLPVRTVLRPTRLYLEAAGSAWPPADAPALPIPKRGWSRVLESERTALFRGDVPVFHARPDATDLRDGDATVVPDCFPRSALAVIGDRLARLSPADLRSGLELIRDLTALAGLTGDRGRGGSGR